MKKKGKPETLTCYRDLHCFKCNRVGHIASQCMNKKTMVELGNNKYATTSESKSSNDMPPLQGASDGDKRPAKDKEFVMVYRLALSAQVVKDEVK